MHGEKAQDERTRILTAFLSGEYDVLVCTGVLGRGLDLRCVKQVSLWGEGMVEVAVRPVVVASKDRRALVISYKVAKKLRVCGTTRIYSGGTRYIPLDLMKASENCVTSEFSALIQYDVNTVSGTGVRGTGD